MTMKTGTASNWLNFLDQMQAALCDVGHAFGLAFTGTGTGSLRGPGGVVGAYVGGANSVAETFTITATTATTFSVVGSTSGNIGTATVGTDFSSALVNFRIVAGGVAFAAGDAFKLSTSPKWELIRRQGAIGTTQRTSDMLNTFYLWDGAHNSNNGWYAYSAALPVYAAIAMLGPAAVGSVGLGVHANIDRGARDFVLEWSDDGVAWTQAQAWAGITWSSFERRTFAVTGSPGAHRHWRIRITAHNGGAQLEVTEVDFLQANGQDLDLARRAEWVVRAPGNDGVSSIYTGVELYEDLSTGAASFNFYGFRSYDARNSVRTQPGVSPLTNVPLTPNAFDWWLFINGRRVVGVAKIGTVYVPFYQGLGKPYELPSVHPYPAINAGCGSDEAQLVGSSSSNFRAFSSPGRYGLYARYPDNTWQAHSNRYEQNGDQGDHITTGKVWPAAQGTSGQLPDLRENLDGTRPLFEIVLTNHSPRHLWGELDGCYWTPGFTATPEQIVTLDGFEHILFQNTFRSGSADFFAIRKD